jgi:hypothetical protein
MGSRPSAIISIHPVPDFGGCRIRLAIAHFSIEGGRGGCGVILVEDEQGLERSELWLLRGEVTSTGLPCALHERILENQISPVVFNMSILLVVFSAEDGYWGSVQGRTVRD